MRGKLITTHEELTSLVQNKKCVLVNYGATDSRLPAISLLYRQYKDTCNLLNKGMLFEYIPKPKSNEHPFKKIYSKKPSVKTKEDWNKLSEDIVSKGIKLHQEMEDKLLYLPIPTNETDLNFNCLTDIVFIDKSKK